ncbi:MULTISPECIES: MurR/RpiR family transcriptional regulator [Staphylococcus]|uniref:MurR/RpiR family transcriptional regulator n=1 Tax=Staphylococcus TaxID=1279 RepID=UPI001E595657|nr:MULTISPECIES: hypothetical protein [Staphylococcus]
MLEHPDEIINYSVQKLADLTNVSVATVVRLSKKLKCKGFQDLKLKIAYDLNEPGNYQRGYAEIDKDYSIMEHFFCKKYFQISIYKVHFYK